MIVFVLGSREEGWSGSVVVLNLIDVIKKCASLRIISIEIITMKPPKSSSMALLLNKVQQQLISTVLTLPPACIWSDGAEAHYLLDGELGRGELAVEVGSEEIYMKLVLRYFATKL